jgi:NADH-quinone oxidoreductase subunit N
MLPGYSPQDFWYLLPELTLTGGLLLLLLADLLTPRSKQGILTALSLFIVGATMASLFPFAGENLTVARGLIAVDGFGFFFKLIVLLAAGLTILMASRYLETEGSRRGEFYFLILCATLGMMFLASGVDLITIFIGLETMAVSFYILVGYLKPNRRSNEAAVKYFLLGAFSLGILLYGMSLLYGLTGSTNLRAIVSALAVQAPGPLLMLALVLIIAGIGFKIAAVPFHMWAPDVYEGAPTPVTAFLSVGSKAASFAMLLRILFEGLPFLKAEWQVCFYMLAVLTMTAGNVLALTQSNVKRMLAYSSIAHAGYVLIGVVAATPRGIVAMLIYLMIYVFMQLGAFAVVTLLRREDVIGDELKDLSGLYVRSPLAATAMLLFMLSLAGIPPTAGFMGKFWLFGAAIEAGYIWLAVIGVLNSVLSLGYYARVVVFMFMKEESVGSPIVARPALATALIVATIGTLGLGLYPRPLFELAELSARSLATVRPAVTAEVEPRR